MTAIGYKEYARSKGITYQKLNWMLKTYGKELETVKNKKGKTLIVVNKVFGEFNEIMNKQLLITDIIEWKIDE